MMDQEPSKPARAVELWCLAPESRPCSNATVGGDAAAHGADGSFSEPRVDKARVEAVATRGEEPARVAHPEALWAHGAVPGAVRSPLHDVVVLILRPSSRVDVVVAVAAGELL